MRSLLLVLFITFLLGIGTAFAGDAGMAVNESVTSGKCPRTLMTKDCLACHTVPTFALKEADPNAKYTYPRNMEFMFDDRGVPVIALYSLTDIDSDYVNAALRYCDRHNVRHIIFDIHSPGGSLFQATKIVGLFDDYKKNGFIIETRCYGFAASAAFYVLANGSKGFRGIAPTAETMWHEVITFKLWAVESPADKEDEARVLRHLQDTTNMRLSEVSKVSKSKIDEMIRKKELWLRGTEVVEYGFADKLI